MDVARKQATGSLKDLKKSLDKLKKICFNIRVVRIDKPSS